MKCLFRNRGVLLNYEHDSFYQLGMLSLLLEGTEFSHLSCFDAILYGLTLRSKAQ